MIKLNRSAKPGYLTDEKVKELTDEYKASGKSVWNNDYIKKPLLESSNNKCAYCECPLTKESNYMEVEHFEDKANNPDKVVLWDNLLPSCKKCNGAKGTHDVIAEPIVNPYIDSPREHFVWRLYRLRGRSSKGNYSIEVCDLNNSNRLVLSRFEIGEKISELVETSRERYNLFMQTNNTSAKNKLLGILEGMLLECQASSAYSASTATMLLTDSRFTVLVDNLKSIDLWTDELESLLQSATASVMEYA